MIPRGFFLADGPADLPLADHLEGLSLELGTELALTAIDPRRLPGAGHSIAGRLEFLARQNVTFDILFVHRDAETETLEGRRSEIMSAALGAGVTVPVVPVVPVRMTEAWLLLYEVALRRVSGRPRGTARIEIPRPRQVETLADPKERLRTALLTASETIGRRRQQFVRDFGRQRALLLRQLDRAGRVNELTSWKRLRADITTALAALG